MRHAELSISTTDPRPALEYLLWRARGMIARYDRRLRPDQIIIYSIAPTTWGTYYVIYTIAAEQPTEQAPYDGR